MKKLGLFLACFCLTCVMQAQEVKHLEETQVTPPKFMELKGKVTVVDGSINEYLIEQLCEPGLENVCCMGTSIIGFTVNKDGKLRDFKIINSVGSPVDWELVNILRTTDGMWKPGLNNGTPVDMYQEVSLMLCSAPGNDYSDFVRLSQHRFTKAGELFYEKNKPKRALRKYNQSARFTPKDKSLLMCRGLCYYELGNIEKAREDWNRLRQLGGIDMEVKMEASMREKDGFEEMLAILKE